MEVQGKIKMIGETQTFGSNGFRKREIVITTAEQYPQHILVEFVQDKVELLDKFQVGQDVIININVRGREWTNPQGEVKYFNSIQGWRISIGQNGADTAIPTSMPGATAPATATATATADDHDDLPF